MQINMQIKLNVHGCCRPWSGLDDRRFLSLDAEKNSTLQSFFLFRTSVSSLAWKPNSNWVWNSWTGFPREGTLEYQHFNCTVANQTQHSHQSTCFSFTDQIYTLTRCLVQDWMSRHRLVTFTSQNILIYIYLIFVTKYKAFDILSDREDSKCSK